MPQLLVATHSIVLGALYGRIGSLKIIRFCSTETLLISLTYKLEVTFGLPIVIHDIVQLCIVRLKVSEVTKAITERESNFVIILNIQKVDLSYFYIFSDFL